jgi:hypothetical protein
MKHPHNQLLPIHLQNMLMSAGDTGRDDLIDVAIKTAHSSYPNLFHDKDSVSSRVFHHEPRQIVPNAGYVIGYPIAGSRD